LVLIVRIGVAVVAKALARVIEDWDAWFEDAAPNAAVSRRMVACTPTAAT